jgi:hypothetical protein
MMSFGLVRRLSRKKMKRNVAGIASGGHTGERFLTMNQATCAAIPTEVTLWQGDPVIPVDWSGIYEGGQIRELPLLDCVPMSTAIFRTYTREGFVIAADGRRRTADGIRIVSDEVQKIFSIDEPSRSLAYAMAGAVYIPNEKGQAAFDFATEAKKAAKTLATSGAGDLTRYAEKFSRLVNNSLLSAKNSGRIAQYPTTPAVGLDNGPGGTIVHLFFIGYYAGAPSWTDVRFFHLNQQLAGNLLGKAPPWTTENMWFRHNCASAVRNG